jgi:hypothetical protein
VPVLSPDDFEDLDEISARILVLAQQTALRRGLRLGGLVEVLGEERGELLH